MKKEFALSVVGAGIVLVLLPWLAACFVSPEGGMMVTILLLFAVNPACFVFEGILAGSHWKSLWSLPILSALLFLAGALWILGMDLTSALLYGGVYLVLGLVTFLGTAVLERRRMK